MPNTEKPGERWVNRYTGLNKAITETTAIAVADVGERQKTLKHQQHITQIVKDISEFFLKEFFPLLFRSTTEAVIARIKNTERGWVEKVGLKAWATIAEPDREKIDRLKWKMLYRIPQTVWHFRAIRAYNTTYGRGESDFDLEDEMQALSYELTQIAACEQLLSALEETGASLFKQFVDGYAEPPLNQENDEPRYTRNYVLRTLIEHISTDLNLLQAAIQQRRRNKKGLAGEQASTLNRATAVALHALNPAVKAGLLPSIPIVTHLDKDFAIRLVPYTNVLLISVAYATMTVQGRSTSTDYLAIAHEVGHYLYWHGHNGTLALQEHVQEALDAPLPQWQAQWLEELFADVYACLVAGPIVVRDFQDRLSDNVPVHAERGNAAHPFPRLRPFILTRILRQIVAGESGHRAFYRVGLLDGLDGVWEERLAGLGVQWGTDGCVEVVEGELGYCFPAGQTLTRPQILQALDPLIANIIASLQSGTTAAQTGSPWIFRWGMKPLADLKELDNSFRRYSFKMDAEHINEPLPTTAKTFLQRLQDAEGKRINDAGFNISDPSFVRRLLFEGWVSKGPETGHIGGDLFG